MYFLQMDCISDVILLCNSFIIYIIYFCFYIFGTRGKSRTFTAFAVASKATPFTVRLHGHFMERLIGLEPIYYCFEDSLTIHYDINAFW